MKPFKNRALSAVLALIVLAFGSIFTGAVPAKAVDDEFEAALEAFPESYQDDLRQIHEEYPNWVFIPVDTGANWEKVVEGESQLGYSLVDGSSASSWKSTQPGAYDWDDSTYRVLDSGGWVQASTEIIRYYLDPRCYLDSEYLFAFLDYSYDPSIQTLEGLERFVEGTFLDGYFYENDTEYYYPEVIMEAAEDYQMNPYVMANMILNEQGVSGIGAQIGDDNEYYNYYSIGAYEADGMNAAERGVWFASLEGSYGRPWDTRYKAIRGGAEYYVENYVSTGQNTIYYKKFNVNPYGAYPIFSHQYMTNIQGAAQEAYMLSNAYSEAAKAEALVFEIPIFHNMPDTLQEKPYGNGSPDNRLKSLKIKDFTLSPKFDTDMPHYSTVVNDDTTEITISASTFDDSATVVGTGTFELNPGVVNVFRVDVIAENGQVRTFTISLSAPGEPINPNAGPQVDEPRPSNNIEYLTSLLPEGSDSSLVVSGFFVHGLPSLTPTVEDVLSMISLSSGVARVEDKEGQPADGNVATGSILQILNEDEEEIVSLEIVLYGDANGDGQVTALDLLRIQKYILGQSEVVGAFLEAADANHDGVVTALDLLRIQKAILGQAEIEQ